MKIKNIMITDVVTVAPSESVVEVADIIFSNRFHGLPVTENGQVVGIVTEDDFFLKDYENMFLPAYFKFINNEKVIEKLPAGYKEKIDQLVNAPVKNIMTSECITVTQDMKVSELMDLVKQTKFTTFPVTDKNKKLIGIVTLSDILGTIKKGSREMKKSLSRESGASPFNQMVGDFNSYWNDKLVLVNRQNIKTLRGVLLIVFMEALVILIMAKILM